MMAAYNRFQHYKNNRSYNNVYYNEHGHFPREGGRQYEMDMGNVNSFGRGQDFNQGNISVVRDTGRNARPPPRPLMNPRVLNVDSHGNQFCMNMGLYPGNMQEEYPMNFRMQNCSGQMNIPVNDIRSQNNICVGKPLWETQRYKFSEALSYIFSSPDDHLSNSPNHRQNLRRETYRKNCVRNNAIERRRFGNRIKMAANTSDEKSSVLFEQKTKNMPEKDTVVSKISNIATQLSALKVCGSGHETKSHEPNIDNGDSEGLQTKQDVPMTTNIEINEGLESPKTQSTPTVANGNQSPGSTQIVGSRNLSPGSTHTVASRNQSAESIQTVASRNQSAGSTQTVASRNQSAESIQTVASRNQSAGSTQTVASRNRSAGSTQTVASRNQSAGSTQTVASRNQSAGSTQTVAGRNQSTGSIQTVASRSQSPGSTQTVAGRNQSPGSTQTVASRNQSTGSTQTVASRNQSAGSTQTVASRNQSPGSTQTVASRNQSTGSTQTVASRSQSPGSTQTVASRNQSAGSTQTVASRNQSTGSTQTVASRNQSAGSTQTVASRNQSAGSTQTVASRNQSAGSTQTVASRNQSTGSTQTVVSRNQSPGSCKKGSSNKNLFTQTQSPKHSQKGDQHQEIVSSTDVTNLNDKNPSKELGQTPTKRKQGSDLDKNLDVVPSQSMEMDERHSRWSRRGDPTDYSNDRSPRSRGNNETRHSDYSHKFINPPPIQDSGYGYGYRHPDSPRGVRETRTFDERDRYEGRWEGHQDNDGFSDYPPKGYGYGEGASMDWRQDHYRDDLNQYDDRWRSEQDRYDDRYYHEYGEGESRDWREDHYRDDLNQYEVRWRSEQDRYDDRYYPRRQEDNWYAEHDNRGRDYDNRDFEERNYDPILKEREQYRAEDRQRNTDNFNHGAYGNRKSDSPHARSHDQRRCDSPRTSRQDQVGGTNQLFSSRKREDQETLNEKWRLDSPRVSHQDQRKSDSPHALHQNKRKSDSPSASLQKGDNNRSPSLEKRNQEIRNEIWRSDSPRKSLQEQVRGVSYYNSRGRNQGMDIDKRRSDSPLRSSKDEKRPINSSSSRERCDREMHKEKRSDSPCTCSDEKSGKYSSNSRERRDREMRNEKRSDSPRTSGDEKSGKNSSNSRERRDQEMRNEKRSDSPCTSGDEKSGKYSSNSRESHDREKSNEKRSEFPHASSEDEKRAINSSNSCERRDQEMRNQKRSYSPRASSVEKRAINSSNSRERRDQEMHNQKRSDSPRASSVEKRAINSSNSCERHDRDMRNAQRISDSPRRSRQDQKEASVEKKQYNDSSTNKRKEMTPDKRLVPKNEPKEQTIHTGSKNVDTMDLKNERYIQTKIKSLTVTKEAQSNVAGESPSKKTEARIKQTQANQSYESSNSSKIIGNSKTWKSEQSFDKRVSTTPMANLYGTDPVIQGDSYNSKHGSSADNTYRHRHGSGAESDRHAGYSHGRSRHNSRGSIPSHSGRHGGVTKQRSAESTSQSNDGNSLPEIRSSGRNSSHFRRDCSFRTISSEEDNQGGSDLDIDIDDSDDELEMPFFLTSLTEASVKGKGGYPRLLAPFRGGEIEDLNDSDSYAGGCPLLLVGSPKPDSSRPIPSTPTKNVTGGVHTDSPVPGGSPQYSGVSADYEAKSSFFSLESLLKETTEKSDKQREFEEIQAELKAGIRRGGFVKDTLEKEEGDDSTVPEELLPEHQVRLKHFHVSKSVMSDTHPGEEIFDPHRFQRLFTSSVTPTNCGLTPGPGLLDRHLSTLQPENFMLLLTSDMMLNFDRLSCPNAVLRWLLFIMSTHKSHLVLNGCLKIIEDHLHTEKHFGNTSKTTWSPAVDDVLSILCNFGAEPSDLLPRTALHTDGDIFREVQVIEVRDNAHNEQGGRYNRENLRLVLHTLAIAFQTRPRYTGQELTQLLIMLCRAALDKSLCNNMLTYEFQLVIASILKLYCETDWNTQSPSLCRMLSSLTSHHHNRVYLCQLLPPTTRGSYLQRRVSYLQLQNLFFPERNMSDNQIHNFEIKKLHSLLPVLQGLSVTDVYKLASAVSLLEMCVGNGLIKSSEKDDIEYLTEQMKKITGDVRDNVQHLDRTRVKDMMIRVTSKWSLALLSVGTKQATLFSYTKRKSPPKMTIETVSASQSDNEDQSSQSEAEEDNFIPEEEENNSALHKKISSLKQSTISDFVKETDCLSSKEIKKEKTDSSYNDQDSIANRDQKSICYESLMNVDTSDEEIDLTQLDDDDLPEL